MGRCDRCATSLGCEQGGFLSAHLFARKKASETFGIVATDLAATRIKAQLQSTKSGNGCATLVISSLRSKASLISLKVAAPFDSERKRRIVILVDWLPPDFGAVGQYMLLRARSLAEGGHNVELIGLTSGVASTKRVALGAGTLTEVKLSCHPVPRNSLLARLKWTLWTDLRLLKCALRSLRAANCILFTGSPPYLIHFLMPLRFLWKGHLVYRITDFHPECLIAAFERPPLVLRLVLALTNFWRRRVDSFEILGEDQRRRLEEIHIHSKRIALVRDQSPVQFGPEQVALSLPPELNNSCVLLYSGNYGIAHEVDTIIEGYRLHHTKGTGRVRLWLNAIGSGADQLERALVSEGLPVHRSPPVALENLASLLLTPHAHFITLKDSFVGLVMPSKVYGVLQSAKPLVFVGSARSDVHLLAQQRPPEQGYWRVECGNPEAFAVALEALAAFCSPTRREDTKSADLPDG